MFNSWTCRNRQSFKGWKDIRVWQAPGPCSALPEDDKGSGWEQRWPLGRCPWEPPPCQAPHTHWILIWPSVDSVIIPILWQRNGRTAVSPQGCTESRWDQDVDQGHSGAKSHALPRTATLRPCWCIPPSPRRRPGTRGDGLPDTRGTPPFLSWQPTWEGGGSRRRRPQGKLRCTALEGFGFLFNNNQFHMLPGSTPGQREYTLAVNICLHAIHK